MILGIPRFLNAGGCQDYKPYVNNYCNGQWSEVLVGDETAVKEHPDSTLFLCWPPQGSLAYRGTCPGYRALRLYKGDRVVYVGEPKGGVTGCDQFFDLLDAEWEEEKIIRIPRYMGLHDQLISYLRK